MGRLGFRLTPARVHVEAGGEAHAGLEVNAPRRRWFGAPAHSPLMVEAEAGASRATALGTFQQRPLLPRWALVVPLLVAAAATWVASRPHQVAVPHVTGLSVSEARAKLKQAGLIPNAGVDARRRSAAPADRGRRAGARPRRGGRRTAAT